jgi:hypothetical protein
METVLTILVFAALVITIGILLLGLVSMARGSEKSNLLMRARVISQFVTIALVVALLLVKASS